jgi:hypothetical protein
MATPSENLAVSLEALKELQDKGIFAIRTNSLSRTDRERLLKTGFIQEVMKGWYISKNPETVPGESTAWFASFWSFCADYLNERFGNEWCLSAEQSVAFHAGDWHVPRQVLVRSLKGGNKPTTLLYDTSILDIRVPGIPPETDIHIENGLRLYKLSAALIALLPASFAGHATHIRAAMSAITDASEVLTKLLEGGHSTIAGRLAGAFRNIGRERIANNILETMRSAGYTIQETDPFSETSPILFGPRETSPYVNRMRIDWEKMRSDILENFNATPTRYDKAAYLRHVDEIYTNDAYHSLSIEGYKVSAELIERVRTEDWNPDSVEADRKNRDGLAARGYWQAFQRVKESVGKVLDAQNPGEVISADHHAWYRELFGPSITAGILKPADLAGYRNGPIYIRNSMHVPPSCGAVRDLMPAFFELLKNENEPAVRVVLGHFMFVYIHPYYDGNGRIGRFLMNLMLASGGFCWTVIPVEERNAYMAALEQASVHKNIVPFTQFLNRLVAASR